MTESAPGSRLLLELKALLALSRDPARGGDKITLTQAWERNLVAAPGPDFQALVPELLGLEIQDPFLRISLRKALLKHPQTQETLLGLWPTLEPQAQAEALQLLGHLRSPQARSLALEALNSSESLLNLVGLRVLGWVGTPQDISKLTAALRTAQEPGLRTEAASAHRQVFIRHPEGRDALIASLLQSFHSETQSGPLGWIILILGDLSGQKFGLKETPAAPELWTGDLEKAKIKVRKSFLTS